MAITQAMCTSFKKELLEGKHDFTNSSGHTFKMSLHTNSATLDAATDTSDNFLSDNQITGTGYTSGGGTLVNVTPTTSGTTALTDFADLTFSSATITARGGVIYNTTLAGGTGTTASVCVLDFGGDKASTNGDFTIQFPAADASNAIIRIA